jgi:hypothetical protein
MMNRRRRKNIWTALAASALFMITLGIAQPMSVASAKHLSHKEVKQLIANAKEPQDHLRLAQYYNSEADSTRSRSEGTRRDGQGLPKDPGG